jgi:hypothetical protein
MNRLKKIALLPVTRISYHMRLMRLYYWSEEGLYALRAVVIMPQFYYRWLYRLCVWMAHFRPFRRLADTAIHTIPYHIRFEVAK